MINSGSSLTLASFAFVIVMGKFPKTVRHDLLRLIKYKHDLWIQQTIWYYIHFSLEQVK